MSNNQKRYLTLTRALQFMGCAVTLSVIIDGKESVQIGANQTAKIPISTSSHEIYLQYRVAFSTRTSARYSISAGSDNIDGEIKLNTGNNNWQITFSGGGVDVDTFTKKVIDFTVRKFQSPSTKELLEHSNNRRKDLSIYFNDKGLTIAFAALETKGLAQWATGEQQYKISYDQMGLTPPTNTAYNFYGQLKDLAMKAILDDPKTEWKKNQYGAFYL